MKRILLFFLILLQLPAFSQKKKANPETRFKGIDAILEQVRKDWRTAGFSVAVVEKNKIVYAKGFGYRDLDKKLPADANTLFAIGSCTKAFTATLIGQLSADGKLNLDQPAVSFLPNLKFYNTEMTNNITPRDMLAHITGLPRHDYSWYFSSGSSRDSLLARIQYMEPSAPIRTHWQYNNFMYMALGAMDEHLSGQSWESNIREKILNPLKMTRTKLNLKEWTADANASRGYELGKDSTIRLSAYYDIAGMSPAGAINSSANEMANWLITWINNGNFEGTAVVPPGFRTEAISSQAITGAGLPGKESADLHFANYGFGWSLSSYKGHYRVEHGGNIDGFTASTTFFPSDSIGIVVLANQNNSLLPSVVRNILSDRMLGLNAFDWSSYLKKSTLAPAAPGDTSAKTASEKGNQPATHPLSDYVGTYAEPGYGKLRISLNKDSLIIRAAGKEFWLRQHNYDSFDMLMVDPVDGVGGDETALRVQFFMDPSGDIQVLSIPFEAGVKPIAFKKQIEVKAVSKETLQKYTGDYEIQGAAVKVYVKNENTLYVLVPGQPEYELVPVGDNKFALKVQSGFFVQFTVAADGKVSDAVFIQPNGNFKAIKK